MQIYIYDKPVTLTEETIAATWKHFADHERLCAEEARAGILKPNDVDKYIEKCESNAALYDSREMRISVTWIQRAYFIQTGECVPILGN